MYQIPQQLNKRIIFSFSYLPTDVKANFRLIVITLNINHIWFVMGYLFL